VTKEIEYCLLSRSAGTIIACEKAINTGIMLIREALTYIFGDLNNVKLSDKRLLKSIIIKRGLTLKLSKICLIELL
jgi:hypothetical protein